MNFPLNGNCQGENCATGPYAGPSCNMYSKRAPALSYCLWFWYFWKVPVDATWLLAVFFGHRPKRFWNDWKKLSHFGQNIWKYKLKITVMASFNATVGQMTEIFQWPKCHSKNDRNVSAKKSLGCLHSSIDVIVNYKHRKTLNRSVYDKCYFNDMDFGTSSYKFCFWFLKCMYYVLWNAKSCKTSTSSESWFQDMNVLVLIHLKVICFFLFV